MRRSQGSGGVIWWVMLSIIAIIILALAIPAVMQVKSGSEQVTGQQMNVVYGAYKQIQTNCQTWTSSFCQGTCEKGCRCVDDFRKSTTSLLTPYSLPLLVRQAQMTQSAFFDKTLSIQTATCDAATEKFAGAAAWTSSDNWLAMTKARLDAGKVDPNDLQNAISGCAQVCNWINARTAECENPESCADAVKGIESGILISERMP